MSDEQDYSHLPVEQKISHNVWKVRLDGYATLIAQFESSRRDVDPCFSVLSAREDSLKSLVMDLNVVAQELAVLLVCKYLEFGCPSSNVSRLKNSGIVLALCEKGLASSRAGTKTKSVDALLLLAEVCGSADWIIEQIVPCLENRLPRLVAGCVHALFQLVSNYGCVVVPPKIIIPALAKLFAHADKNVRAETTKLTVELYIWLREGLTAVLFASLKPVQQRDLTAEFAKVQDAKAEQKRITRAQKEKILLRKQHSMQSTGDGDVAMQDASDTEAAPVFDPFDAMDPVDVLLQLSGDVFSRVSSLKWKDRVEALEEVQAVLAKAPKLANDDYSELVRLFVKCFKDANIQVVQLAANGVEALSRGLKEHFQKYRGLVLAPIIDRSKEKKPVVADALANALDAIFESSTSLLDVLDETLTGMKHKTPQVKIAATSFLQRCLASTAVAPKPVQTDSIMQVGLKLLTDSQEPIRQVATEMVGTLMKITSERELRALLENVDENRLAKVRAVFEKATVKVTSAAPAAKAAPASGNTSVPKPVFGSKIGAPQLRLPTATALKKPVPPQSIPSKRLATSPAKRADSNTKVPVKSFTGRQLISPSANGSAAATSASLQPRPETPVIPAATLEEMRMLKEENRRLKTENDLGAKAQATLIDKIHRLEQENTHLSEKVDQLYRDNTNGNLMVKQKDTQIMRLMSDLENAKLKIKSLDQTVEIMKLQTPTMQSAEMQPAPRDSYTSPFASPRRFSLSRLSLTELSSRVNRLSIDGSSPAQNIGGDPPLESHPAGTSNSAGAAHAPSGASGAPATDARVHMHASTDDGISHLLGSGEDNWRKATEVTAQLKARIEKMKQRNRLANK